MVDKPKTYAQQVQELKQILSQRDEELTELQAKLDEVPGLKAEIERVTGILAGKSQDGHTETISNKSKFNDLQQRAESAEKNVREIKALYSQLESQNNVLRNMCYENNSRFEDKIEKLEANNSYLANELLEEKAKNRGLSLQLRDMRNDTTNRISDLEKQLSYQKQVNRILEQKTQRANDNLQSLKNLAKEM